MTTSRMSHQSLRTATDARARAATRVRVRVMSHVRRRVRSTVDRRSITDDVFAHAARLNIVMDVLQRERNARLTVA